MVGRMNRLFRLAMLGGMLLSVAPARAGEAMLETRIGEVEVRLFIPESPGPLRGIIVHAANYKLSDSDRWAELGRQIRFAHVAMNIPNVQKATNRHAKLYKALHEGLKEFSVKSQRPELVNLPLAGTGHSAGGLVTGVLLKDPDRTLGNCIDCAWVMDSTKLAPEAAAVPALFTMGAIEDAFKMLPAVDQHFYPARQKGLPWGLGLQWGCAHDFGNSAAMMIPWVAAVAELRLPRDFDGKDGPPKLGEIKREEGWLGDLSSISGNWATVAPWKEYAGDKSKAAWFPGRSVAWTWRAWQSKDSPVVLRAQAGVDSLGEWNPKKANDLMVDPGVEIVLSAKAARAVKKVRYFDGDVLVGEGAGSEWSFIWRKPPIGYHVIHAQWEDETGRPGAGNPALIVVRMKKQGAIGEK